MVAFAASLMLAPFAWRAIVESKYGDQIYKIQDVPKKDVAIVYGAAVYPNGRLSAVLRDRIETAIALYEKGSVQKLLMTGDQRDDSYDEPGTMAEYAISRGIMPEDLLVDGAGKRTYDSCYRAREVFGISNAVLISQAFHLPRALFTCEMLGINSVGVAADQRSYRGARWYAFRETLATMVALIDVIEKKPPAIMGRLDLN